MRFELSDEHTARLVEVADGLPARASTALCSGSSHRALGRIIRDAVAILVTIESLDDACVLTPQGTPSPGAHLAEALSRVDASSLVEPARTALTALSERQNSSGTFQGGDNLDSPPDTAFTVNDLAWARTNLTGAELSVEHSARNLTDVLDHVLNEATPALVTGGVHTPNHRWEIASALARLWELYGRSAARDRAEQWLAEGIDLQSDGLFSERSANYAARVSAPSLLTLGRVFCRPDLTEAADRGVRRQADLTGSDGFVETIASRRQDQFAPFSGGALYPLFRAHAARTRDGVTARAAERTAPLAAGDDLVRLLTLGIEDPAALHPLPAAAGPATASSPELIELRESGLTTVDHGESSAVVVGGTDTAVLGRITSGASSQAAFARFRGTHLTVREMRLSRDFFSMGPFRPSPPVRTSEDASAGEAVQFTLNEHVQAEYFHPLDPSDRREDGAYALGFNGRFASAMDFEQRRTEAVTLDTTAVIGIAAGAFAATFSFEGPSHPTCVLLALDCGSFEGTRMDEAGRHLLISENNSATCSYIGHGERLDISAQGALGGQGFYAPGEAYTFLGGTDEPTGDVLLIPASSSEDLRLQLRLRPDTSA